MLVVIYQLTIFLFDAIRQNFFSDLGSGGGGGGRKKINKKALNMTS